MFQGVHWLPINKRWPHLAKALSKLRAFNLAKHSLYNKKLLFLSVIFSSHLSFQGMCIT